MEVILENQLKRRSSLLQEAIAECKECIAKCSTGVPESELFRVKLEITQGLETLDKEIKFYLTHAKEPSAELVESCTDIQINAEKMQRELDSIDRIIKSNTSGETSTCKLPKLDLVKFSGDILQFSEFWDRFKATVHAKNITDAEKLAYLLNSVEGKAREALQGLNATNENYGIAVEILQNRYGSKALVIDAHYEALNKLKTATKSASECRANLNNIEKHLRILESLGEDVNNNHLRVVMTSKFPENVLYQLNLLTPIDRDVKVLREGLNKIITALERAEIDNASTSKESEALKATTASLHTRAVKRPQQDISKDRQQKRQKIQCAFCSGTHFTDKCHKYRTMEERKRRLNGKCFSCFRPGHGIKTCRMKSRCFFCKTNLHNTALCPVKLKQKIIRTATAETPKTQAIEKANADESNNPTLDLTARNMEVSNSANLNSFLQTAMARIKNGNVIIPCRILLDSGSQRSYITTRIATKLQIKPEEEDRLVIYTFGSDMPQEISSPTTNVVVETKRGIKRKVRVNIVPQITNRVPVNELKLDKDVVIDILADDDSLGDTIDMLIGNDYYFLFMRKEHLQMDENLFLINTDFGWVISGITNLNGEDTDNMLNVVTYCQCHESACPYFAEPDLPLRNIDMKFLWSLESIGISDSPKSTREEEAVKYFNDTTIYDEGRYLVKWPWIQYPPELPTNFGLAYGRLKHLLQRSNEAVRQECNEIIQEQLLAKVIEVVGQTSNPMNQANPPVHYLPHHIVHQEGKRGRMVYDASAKLKDQKSLNECLYRGPSMLEDLIGLLLKFRTNAIGITADVEKAFLQIGLQEDDRDVTRFLWLKDINKELSEENLLHLRFCRVPFGIISSPFLLTATIRNHIARTNGKLMEDIADKCYMDNLLTGAPTVKKAEKLFQDTQTVFKELSMNIRDWMSNDEDLMRFIPETLRSNPKDKCKVLGLMWDVKRDILELNLSEGIFQDNNIEKNNTKRDVLRTLARIFDPHGFVAPLVLPIKMLFQELCVLKVKWDKVLPEEMLQKWRAILKKLKAVREVQIPRYLEQGNDGKEKTYELHTFADASKNGYAAVTYLRIVSRDKATVSFIMSKARITPTEDKDDLKIPRLELLACLIGSRLNKYVKDNIGKPIHKQFLWTDSCVVLNWLKSSKLLPPFVSRRVTEIKQNKDVEFCYINTNENPADLATRPELWDLKKALWFAGPAFLAKDVSMWPANRHINEQQTSLFVGESLDSIDGPEMTMKGYETELPDYLAQNQDVNGQEEEPRDESVKEIREIQREYFSEEVNGKITSLTRNLNLFMDVDGVLRCKGRLTHADWSYDARYPILIPRDSPFTNEIVKTIHEKNYHVGVSHTLSLIRQRYWIPQGKAQVQKILKKCPQCVKHGGGPYTLPAPPALPAERVNYSRPFTFTGIDYFGPIFVDSESGRSKRWVCLFTCLAVRAIHLEIVRDLTAEECLLALRRFTASRGLPKKIVSDNALYFKLTSEVLTAPFCTESQIEWKFIPQLAPWHGGFYERLVGLVKHCLKRTLDKHLLKESQLATVMKEVEAVVNTRPLTSVGADLEYVLSPADFLSAGKCLEVTLSEVTTDRPEGTATKIDLVQGWRRGQLIMDEFKKMFVHQYLPSLREKHRFLLKQPRVMANKVPQIGDMVQLKDDSKNRINWKVGKITSLIKGSDGQCRVAKVKVGSSELTRSIGHLYPLEAEESEHTVLSDNAEGPLMLDQLLPANEPAVVEDMEVDAPRELEASNVEMPMTPEVVEKTSNSQLMSDEMEVSSTRDTNQTPRSDASPVMESSDMSDIPMLDVTQGETSEVQHRPVRGAAIRARERIAEWTRQLVALLATSSSLGSVAELNELHE